MAGRWLTAARRFVPARCPQVCASWGGWMIQQARLRRAASSPPMSGPHPFPLSDSLTQRRAAKPLRISSMDPGSTVVQEASGLRERGVGAAPPGQPNLCLKRREAYIWGQGIHLTDMMKPGTAAMVDRRPTRREGSHGSFRFGGHECGVFAALIGLYSELGPCSLYCVSQTGVGHDT